MSKNVRISLYILVPVIAWMISGQFVEEVTLAEKVNNKLSSVVISESKSAFFSPSIKLNSSAEEFNLIEGEKKADLLSDITTEDNLLFTFSANVTSSTN